MASGKKMVYNFHQGQLVHFLSPLRRQKSGGGIPGGYWSSFNLPLLLPSLRMMEEPTQNDRTNADVVLSLFPSVLVGGRASLGDNFDHTLVFYFLAMTIPFQSYSRRGRETVSINYIFAYVI